MSPGRAKTSSTRPVAGACTRMSASSLNWTLPVVSMTLNRVRYSGATTSGVRSVGAAAVPASGFGEASGGTDESPQAALKRARSRRTAHWTDMLVLSRTADGGLELVESGPEVTERAQVLEGDFAVRLLRLRQVGVAQRHDPLALDEHGRERRVHLGERLHGGRLPKRVGALDLGSRPRDLALIPVEDPQGDAEAKADRVVAPDPLVRDLRRHVPPRVGAGQTHVRARLLARRLDGSQVGTVLDGEPPQRLAVERELTEAQLSDDVEGLGDRVGTHSGSERDLGGVDGLPGVARVPLEREALDLQADQLELRDVALLGPDALDPLDLVEGLEVLGGQRARGLGHQDVGERLLDLEDHLPADVGQLVRGHPRCRLRALDPPEALAARLDQLAESDDVLRLGRAPAELVGAVGCGWVRPQRGGDLVRARGLDLERLGAQRGVLACRHRDRLVEREPRQSILRVGQAGNEHEREHD